ncbi:MAG: hypothetical protein WBM62_18380, partial [Crocosphaera sp.]
MTHINYLTIDLFVYDLAESLGENDPEREKRCRRFWERIYPNITNEKLARLKARENQISSFIKLLDPQETFIPFPNKDLDGYYYPVKIGDTYGLQIDYSGKKNTPQENSLNLAEKLPQLKEIILEHIHDTRGQMGETWLIWGQLTQENEDIEKAAKDCYYFSDIVPQKNWKRDLKGQGNYNNVHLFELSQPDINPDGINQSYHLIICLFPANTSKTDRGKTIRKLQRNLIEIFSYRHKILWSYEQSRQLKRTLKSISTTVNKLIDSLDDSLK